MGYISYAEVTETREESTLKALIILADAVIGHPDNTFSLLRGGITELNVLEGKPLVFAGALLVRVSASAAESGPHEIKVRCLTEDGATVIPDLMSSFNVPERGGFANLVMQLQVRLPKPGRYEFSVSVDKHELDSWILKVKEATKG